MTKYKSTDHPKLIIVDDEDIFTEMLQGILDEEGYLIRCFNNGKEAIESARRSPPDLFLLDIMMPEMDGYELCTRLKSINQLKDVPVLFISGKTDIHDKVMAFARGAVDYIPKPFHAEEVKARIKTHLSIRQFQQELKKKNTELSDALHNLKLTQNKLVQSEKMASLGLITAGLAHEINNPLTFISVGSETIKEDLDSFLTIFNLYEIHRNELNPQAILEIETAEKEFDVGVLKENLNSTAGDIRLGVDRIMEIIKGLKMFSRSDEIEKKIVDIHALIDSTVVLLSHRLKQGIKLKKYYDPEIKDLNCFPGQLGQVFMNLFNNAIDSMDRNTEGLLTISTKNLKKHIEISVKDNGPGISKENIDKIFDPFFTTKEVGDGTGLGLYISHGIIEKHGGEIDIRNDSGGGAEFIISLPK